MPIKNPPHPGDFIRTELVEPAGLSVTAAAAALQVSRPALSSLLNGKAGLSGEMALRIEKALGVKMDTLMRMQSAYDIAQTRKREKEIRVRRIHRTSDIPRPVGTSAIGRFAIGDLICVKHVARTLVSAASRFVSTLFGHPPDRARRRLRRSRVATPHDPTCRRRKQRVLGGTGILACVGFSPR